MTGIILGGTEGADTSAVTATASDVLAGKKIVNAEGEVINGTIETYSGDTILYPSNVDNIITAKYVPSLTFKAISTQEKSIYPSFGNTVVTPDAGKYLSAVNGKRLIAFSGGQRIDTSVQNSHKELVLDCNPSSPIDPYQIINIFIYSPSIISSTSTYRTIAAVYTAGSFVTEGKRLYTLAAKSATSNTIVTHTAEGEAITVKTISIDENGHCIITLQYGHNNTKFYDNYVGGVIAVCS